MHDDAHDRYHGVAIRDAIIVTAVARGVDVVSRDSARHICPERRYSIATRPQSRAISVSGCAVYETGGSWCGSRIDCTRFVSEFTALSEASGDASGTSHAHRWHVLRFHLPHQ